MSIFGPLSYLIRPVKTGPWGPRLACSMRVVRTEDIDRLFGTDRNHRPAWIPVVARHGTGSATGFVRPLHRLERQIKGEHADVGSLQTYNGFAGIRGRVRASGVRSRNVHGSTWDTLHGQAATGLLHKADAFEISLTRSAPSHPRLLHGKIAEAPKKVDTFQLAETIETR